MSKFVTWECTIRMFHRKRGEGMTAVNKPRKKLRAQRPEDAIRLGSAAQAWKNGANRPWAFCQTLVDIAKARVESMGLLPERESAIPINSFRPRVDEEWYWIEIYRRSRSAQSLLAGGVPGSALQLAVEVGMLAKEMQMKFEFEEDWFIGKAQRENLKRGSLAAHGHVDHNARRSAMLSYMERHCCKAWTASEALAAEFGVTGRSMRSSYKKAE